MRGARFMLSGGLKFTRMMPRDGLKVARLTSRAVATALLACAATHAGAQEYPGKPIKMLIPFVAGGTTDVLARVVAQQMADDWKVQVVPDNHPGANGIIAAEMAAKAPGDGYTLLFVAMGHAVNPLMYKKLPYDTERDFTPISLVGTFAQMVLVHPSVPAKDLKELIALAKNGPRPLSYASGGIGSSQHLGGALLAYMAGIKMDHVPYKGGAPGLLDVIAGNVNLMVSQPTSMSFITSGKLRALAISSPTRSPRHPDLPTVAEAGVPGYQSLAWYGLVGPKNMPADVLKKISDETMKATRSKQMTDALNAQGGDAVGGTPAEFAAYIKAETARYAKVVKEAGISAE